MKRIKIKRLIFYRDNEYIIGAREYDGRLSDANILQSFYEVGKTAISQYGSMWLLKDGKPLYRIGVDTFYQYQKVWYDYLWDWIRRH